MYDENLREKILRFEQNVMFWGEFLWNVHICPTLALKTSRKQRSCDEKCGVLEMFLPIHKLKLLLKVKQAH